MADADSHMPCHAHAVPMLRCAVALRSHYQNGMACVNQTRPRCVYPMGNTRSKPLAEWHGMAGEQHGMCELA
jgi:ribosome modulation factor